MSSMLPARACSWAIAIANNPAVGYSQANRWLNPDVDCSSFMILAYRSVGIDISDGNNSNSGNTASLFNNLPRAGFVDVKNSVNMQTGAGMVAGDVCLKHGHVVMYAGGGKIVHASMSENGGLYGQGGDQTGLEVCVANYYNDWEVCYRYGEGEIPIEYHWIKDNTKYFADYGSEQQNNAICFYFKMMSYGWSLNAIAGTLGNITSESTINPDLWQSFQTGNQNVGYGLVQWTPASKFIAWANGRDYTDGDIQCERLNWEVENNQQWIIRQPYNMTFKEYAVSTADPSYLAEVFINNYERPKDPIQPIRGVHANYWYQFLSGVEPPIAKKKSKFLPIYGNKIF